MAGEMVQASEDDKEVDGHLGDQLGFKIVRHRSGFWSCVVIEMGLPRRSREITRATLRPENEHTTY